MTSTLGIERPSTQSPHAGDKGRRRLRPLAALAVIAMVALISAGCSNAPAETGAGSNGGGNANAANYAKAVKFAECMRENGVRRFPDPDASGRLTIDGVAYGSSVDFVGRPAIVLADEHLLLGVPTGHPNQAGSVVTSATWTRRRSRSPSPTQ
jgi:hypothetical protein